MNQGRDSWRRALCGLRRRSRPTTIERPITIELAQFVLELDRPVKVMKIDVEGVECTLVHHLLDRVLTDWA